MKTSFPNCLILVLVFCFLACQLGCDSSTQKAQEKEQEQVEASKDESAAAAEHQNDGTFDVVSDAVDPLEHLAPETSGTQKTRSLFDGKTLDGWETIEFGGEGDVKVVDGEMHMYDGDPLTGICVTEDVELPTANYEFSIEALKFNGHDFFCAVTFPVNDSFCTMVVGGWGGNLVGLSNLDGQDASSNQTKLMRKFEKDKWYAIRIKVLPDRITAWIDDEKLIDESIEGVEVGIRGDVSTTTPLGITNFETSSSFRNIQILELD